jgi:hypothetical protein
MNTILIITVVLILLVGMLLLYKDYYIKRKFRKVLSTKYRAIEPLIKKIASAEIVSAAEILTLSKDASLRYVLFRTLHVYNRQNLFPDEYFTYEKGAESFLVNWLEFPTELGSAPDEIELITKITLTEDEAMDYYVFKFRTNPPHWAAQYDWMMGVCGPYKKESTPYDIPLRIFSRFKVAHGESPEREAQWVHENISK